MLTKQNTCVIIISETSKETILGGSENERNYNGSRCDV